MRTVNDTLYNGDLAFLETQLVPRHKRATVDQLLRDAWRGELKQGCHEFTTDLDTMSIRQ